MKASTLKNRIAKTLNKDGSEPKNRHFTDAMEVIMKGRSYIGYYSGSGRYRSAHTSKPFQYLVQWGISVEYGNDAPRGGVTGEYCELTKKGERQVREFVKQRNIEIAEAQEKQRAEMIKIEERRQERLKAVKEKYNEIKEGTFFQMWNDSDLKEASGKSWNQFRNDLKISHPEEWKKLKAEFKAKQAVEQAV